MLLSFTYLLDGNLLIPFGQHCPGWLCWVSNSTKLLFCVVMVPLLPVFSIVVTYSH